MWQETCFCSRPLFSGIDARGPDRGGLENMELRRVTED